jgi:chorismate mutase/prephenate dehydratase
MKLYCLGPEGTNSHEAALLVREKYHHFMGKTSGEAQIEFCAFNTEVLERVQRDHCMGVVAIENSTEGWVRETVKFWLTQNRARLFVLGEIELQIEHHLFVHPSFIEDHSLDDVAVVLSHAQALGQCSQNLKRMKLGDKTLPVSSTALAAQKIATDPEYRMAGAIASRYAGGRYGLKLLAANLEDTSDNVTRFHILGPWEMSPSGHDRTAMLVMPRGSESYGALSNVCTSISMSRVNMSSVHSIPVGPGKYAFYMEIECHRDDDEGRVIFKRLETVTEKIIVLGSYPRTISNSTKKEA